MDSAIQGKDIFFDTPLGHKVTRVSRSVPRKLQWRLFNSALFLSDFNSNRHCLSAGIFDPF